MEGSVLTLPSTTLIVKKKVGYFAKISKLSANVLLFIDNDMTFKQ